MGRQSNGIAARFCQLAGRYHLSVLFRLCEEERAEYQTPRRQHGYGREVQGGIEHHHAVVFRRSGIYYRAGEAIGNVAYPDSVQSIYKEQINAYSSELFYF